MSRRHFQAALIVAMLAALVSPLMAAAPAFACSCAGHPFEEPYLPGPDATVFVGTVTGQDVDEEETTWRFDVESVLQGTLGPTVDVNTSTDGASCGFEREAIGDRRAVVVRQSSDGQWRSDLCSIDSAEAAADFGTPMPPDPQLAAADPSDTSVDDGILLPVVGGVMLVTLFALAIGLTLGRRGKSPRRRKPPI